VKQRIVALHDAMVKALHENTVTAPRCHRTVISVRHHQCMKRDVIDGLLVESLPALPRSRRVAMVTETYPPEINGVAMSMARLVNGLHERHHDVQLVRPRQALLPDVGAELRFSEVLTRGLPIPRYPHLRMGLPSKRSLVRVWSLRRPDAVHIATEGPLGWSALQAARHLQLPVTTDFRTNFHAYGQHYGIGWLTTPILAYLRKFHNRAHCTMVPTDAMRTDLAARGFERLHVVGRGVDTKLFDPAKRCTDLRARWGAGANSLVLAYVGRLAAEKNLDAVLAAYEAMRARRADTRLLFVGDGPMRSALHERCPQAIFAGHRSGEDLAAHYASADLFLFPSLTETFGNVTTEAMASGLPVVAFDSAAAGQLIQSGRNGMLAIGNDHGAFVRAALALADDTALRASLGAAARETACRIDWRNVVGRFESILSQVIDSSSPALQLKPALA
jgi:glycosyltransferase involved in cell wall biosynthesis